MWDMRSLYRNHYKTVFCTRASRLRLAFEDFRSAKGRYPTELAELVPDCIAAVPLDPYDEQPIRYNAEHGYFWTPGPDGTFDGKVDFDEDGYPRWKNRNYHFVQLLDTTKGNRPPSTYCTMSRRKAVGIRNSTHFNRYYLSPLLERGIIARTDPDHPQSPQQRYCLT